MKYASSLQMKTLWSPGAWKETTEQNSPFVRSHAAPTYANGEVCTLSNADRHAEQGRQALVKPLLPMLLFDEKDGEISLPWFQSHF